MSENSHFSEFPFSHVLQRTGLLKSFRVAKVVTGKEIRELKDLIREATNSKKEYDKMLSEEMNRIAQFDETKNPVPGIVFFDGDSRRAAVLLAAAKAYKKRIKAHNLSKNQTCFLILSIIKELELDQSDFEEIGTHSFPPMDLDTGEDEDDDDDGEEA